MPASNQTCFLVLDAGSGAGRAMVFNQTGEMLAQSYREWAYQSVTGIPDAVSFDPDIFLKTLLDAAKQVITRSGISPTWITGITSTCLREGVVFLDSDGKELYCGPNFDGRAERKGKQLETSLGAELYRLSGTYPPAYGYLARLMWFRTHQPETFEKIAKVLEMGGWITYRLTGALLAEPTLAGASGVFSIAEGRWAKDIFQSLGMDPALLPEIQTAGSLVGNLLPEIASIIGVPANTPVFLGGGDSHCALLGMGCLHSGDTGIIAGTTSPAMQITTRPILDKEMRTWSSNYLIHDLWVLESNAIVTGLAYRWLRDCLFPGSDFSEIEEELAGTAPGSKGIQAFLGAELMDMKHYTGQWQGGFRFPVPPSETTRGDFARAVIESNAYAVRANINQIESITGMPARGVHICGGQMESDIIPHILTDIINKPAMIHKGQRAALGAAMLAALGCGLYPSLEQAVERMRGKPEEMTPDSGRSRVYEPLFHEWMQVYQQIKYKKEIINA